MNSPRLLFLEPIVPFSFSLYKVVFHGILSRDDQQEKIRMNSFVGELCRWVVLAHPLS